MKKVLVISRLFPPENRAAANRAQSWANYFHQNGLYPVFITRDWAWKTFDISHKKFDGYEVYYVPFKQRKSYSYKVSNNSLLQIIGGLLHYWGYLFEYSFRFQPDGRLYRFAAKFLAKNHSEIDIMLVTAPPFIYLKMGYHLSKKFGKPWVADFRDEWNSEGSIFKKNDSRPISLKILDIFKTNDKVLEVRWCRHALGLTTVAEAGVKNLKNIHNRKDVYLIPNGFLRSDFEGAEQKDFKILTFTYAGTLHKSQEIEPFLTACKMAYQANPKIRFQIIFLGLSHNPERVNFIKNLLGDAEKFFIPTHKVEKAESISTQLGSHYLLLFRHKGIKDIPSSKLYEYVGAQRPILHYPSDDGVMQNTLELTGQMVLGLSNPEAVSKFIIEKALEVSSNKWVGCTSNPEQIKNFEREGFATEMAQILNEG